MADSMIAQYLNKILKGVYGKEVRQAIYDSISQCYSDGKAGTIDLIARRKIEELNADVLEMQETGATAEVIKEKVHTVINELIADGTMSGMTLADGSVTLEKLAEEVLTSLEVSAVYNETIGDLSFNAVESLVSAYPVGLENAEIEVVGSEMSSTAVVTENKNFSYTKKFVLQEGVYIIPPVWKSDDPNYGYNTIRLIEFLKDDDSVCTGAIFSRAYPSGGSEKTSTIIAVVDSDKVYTVSNNNEVIEKFRFKKNTESVIAPVTFDIVQMIQDGLNISTSQYYIVFDITKQIPPNKVIGIKKMTHNAGTMVTYANKYGTYTTVRTANKIIPTEKSWDSTYFRNQISTDGTTTWLSIGGEGDYLYNALVELNYKIFVE